MNMTISSRPPQSPALDWILSVRLTNLTKNHKAMFPAPCEIHAMTLFCNHLGQFLNKVSRKCIWNFGCSEKNLLRNSLLINDTSITLKADTFWTYENLMKVSVWGRTFLTAPADSNVEAVNEIFCSILMKFYTKGVTGAPRHWDLMFNYNVHGTFH